MTFSKESFLAALPLVLAEDTDMRLMAEVIAELYERDFGQLENLLIYPAVDRLGGDVLDALAYDFKADWWDPGMTLDEKRRAFKAVWATHRLAGTKEGVERAVGAVSEGAEISEWFEYGGEPYHFRLGVKLGAQEAESADDGYKDRVFRLLEIFKNLRSVSDGVEFSRDTPLGDTVWVSAAAAAWHSAALTDKTMPAGLLYGMGNRATGELTILPGLPSMGGHPVTAWEEGDTLCIACEGLTVAEDGDTLVITGG